MGLILDALSPTPATTALYTPLIDMVPADPDTMMTAMCEAQRLTVKCGQEYTVFTADQQLYTWSDTWSDGKCNVGYPELFVNFIPSFGGMYMLISFVGCVWTLMANSGWEDVL